MPILRRTRFSSDRVSPSTPGVLRLPLHETGSLATVGIHSALAKGVIARSYLCPARHNLIFELDGLEFLQPGAPVSFLDRLRVGETDLSAQLDNVLSVALIVHLFRQGFRGTALFTAQEEAGRSRRYALEWFRRKDASAPFDPRFTSELETLCQILGIRQSFKDAWIERENEKQKLPGI